MATSRRNQTSQVVLKLNNFSIFRVFVLSMILPVKRVGDIAVEGPSVGRVVERMPRRGNPAMANGGPYARFWVCERRHR